MVELADCHVLCRSSQLVIPSSINIPKGCFSSSIRMGS